MEKELNIAAILKDKPNAKLWSPTFGNSSLVAIFKSPKGEELIKISGDDCIIRYIQTNGHLVDVQNGEICIFPSREMRDWSKFAWKKGDVLFCGVDDLCLFDKWANNQYTEFYGRYGTKNYSKGYDKLDTECWSKVNSKEVKLAFIKHIEEFHNGRLNLETLDIEQPNPEFKDGDILYDGDGNQYLRDCIFIAKYDKNGRLSSECALIDEEGLCLGCKAHRLYEHTRLATDSEKQQLYDALAKKGKRWNPDTKQIEDLPKMYEFNQMDLCLMSDGYDESLWNLCQFAFKDGEGFYHSIGGGIWRECIPYNDSTKHLLGTTDEWKGGEG